MGSFKVQLLSISYVSNMKNYDRKNANNDIEY